MKIRILHCVLDEKFIDSMISMTGCLWKDCYQKYAIISNRKNFTYNYVRKCQDVLIIKKKDFVNYINRNEVNVVILHSLLSIPFSLIPNIKKEIAVVWFAWGYDIYHPYFMHRPFINKNLFHKETKEVIAKDVKERCRNFFRFCLYVWQQPKIERAISRVDFFSGVIPDEYNMVVDDKRNSFFKARPLVFNYGDMDSPYTEANINAPYVNGKDIQIGNSAAPTNNHIDLFDLLAKYSLGDRKLYVPLSYGGTAFYCNTVMQYGEKKWGNRFRPINVFVPLEEYRRILASSYYAIFYHERQQAMGNIISALWRGCMVFLSETSPLYGYLKERGYIFYAVQRDLYKIKSGERMKEEDIKRNRRLIIGENSIEIEKEKSAKIVKTLKEYLNSYGE